MIPAHSRSTRTAPLFPYTTLCRSYRTVLRFEEAGILDRHDFGDGRSRYGPAPESHHDHLIDVETGKVIEFVDPELEQLQKQIAEKLGFRLVDHRMELYGAALNRKAGPVRHGSHLAPGRRPVPRASRLLAVTRPRAAASPPFSSSGTKRALVGKAGGRKVAE